MTELTVGALAVGAIYNGMLCTEPCDGGFSVPNCLEKGGYSKASAQLGARADRPSDGRAPQLLS